MSQADAIVQNSIDSRFHSRFRLHGLPKRTTNNSRTHWASRYKEAKTWKQWVCLAVRGRKPKVSPSEAQLVLTRVGSSAPNYDGLVSSFKRAIDGLVEAGVIESDKMSVIGILEYRWPTGRPRGGLIAVEVSEIVSDLPPQEDLN